MSAVLDALAAAHPETMWCSFAVVDLNWPGLIIRWAWRPEDDVPDAVLRLLV